MSRGFTMAGILATDRVADNSPAIGMAAIR